MRVRFSPAPQIPYVCYYYLMGEGGQESELVPFHEQSSGELLTGVINSDKFQKALSSAARKTASTGYETRFEVYLDSSKRVFILDVVMGGTDSIDPNFSSQILAIDGANLDPRSWLARYIDLHFHPFNQRIPSAEDLKGAFGVSKIRKRSDMPTYMMVGAVDRKGTISILCVNKPTDRLIKEDLDQYVRDTYDIVHNHSKAVESLKKLDLKVFEFQLHKHNLSGKTRYMLNDESQREISSKSKSDIYYTVWMKNPIE